MSEAATGPSAPDNNAAGPVVTNNPALSRYEARIDGELAGIAEYDARERSITFVHTETSPEFEGRGVGGALARFGLDDAIASGKTIVALCPFIKGYIAKHPEYQQHLAGARRG